MGVGHQQMEHQVAASVEVKDFNLFVCVFFFVNLRLLKDDDGECANGSAPNKKRAGEGVALRERGRGNRFLCCCTIIVELLLFITTYTLFDFSYKEFQFFVSFLLTLSFFLSSS